jgi:hypothetical protein
LAVDSVVKATGSVSDYKELHLRLIVDGSSHEIAMIGVSVAGIEYLTRRIKSRLDVVEIFEAFNFTKDVFIILNLLEDRKLNIEDDMICSLMCLT